MKATHVIRRLLPAALVFASLSLSTGVRADQEITAHLSMAMQVKGKVTETGCQNSPGPTITLEAEIALGGLQACLIFQNNTKGPHKTSVTYAPISR